MRLSNLFKRFLELQRLPQHSRWSGTERDKNYSSKSCQDELLRKLHDGHFGVESTKFHARDSVYWRHISRNIEDLVKSCEKCQEFSRRNSKDPVLPRELPLIAWALLELDLFTCENVTFLLIVDVTL